jgi:lysozyme
LIPERHKKKVVWIAICLSCTAGAEGMRQTAYQDPSPAATWTICLGETKGVHPGDHKTRAECEAMLEGRLYQFGAEVDSCTKVPLPPKRKAAMTDFAYNEGSYRYCKYIAPKLNAGDVQGACDTLLHFTKAGGIEFPGLVKRRQQERALCLG